MDSSSYKLFDLKRIFIGNAPPEFLIEVFIRTLIVYFFFLIVIRLMGKRMSSQISITEFSVLVTLGAIISPVMQLPDRGILYSFTALTVICILHSLINYWGTKNEKIEEVVQGRMECFIKDGVMQFKAMRNAGISRQELFAQLRKNKIENLAEVERVYIEACGLFAVYKKQDHGIGLPTLPQKDQRMLSTLSMVDHHVMACKKCGNVQQIRNKWDECDVCKAVEWTEAYETV